jgi:hypothetical protein
MRHLGSLDVLLLYEETGMAWTEEQLQPLSEWRHVATGSEYIVLAVGQCSTNGPRENIERSVIYWSKTYRGYRYREVSEFLDGRFELIDRSGTPKKE